MVSCVIKRSRIALLAGLIAATLASAAQAQTSAKDPFAGYTGSWSGGGKISLTDGSVERLRCTAKYHVEEDGTLLVQSFDCASDSYKFDLENTIKASGSEITGTWIETTRSAQGMIAGRMTPGHVEGTVTGGAFSATFAFSERGNRQQIVIHVQGASVSEISAELARAR